MSKKPPEEREPDSLEKLADFTRQILQVPRDELPRKDDSTGTPPKIDEPCPET